MIQRAVAALHPAHGIVHIADAGRQTKFDPTADPIDALLSRAFAPAVPPINCAMSRAAAAGTLIAVVIGLGSFANVYSIYSHLYIPEALSNRSISVHKSAFTTQTSFGSTRHAVDNCHNVFVSFIYAKGSSTATPRIVHTWAISCFLEALRRPPVSTPPNLLHNPGRRMVMAVATAPIGLAATARTPAASRNAGQNSLLYRDARVMHTMQPCKHLHLGLRGRVLDEILPVRPEHQIIVSAFLAGLH